MSNWFEYETDEHEKYYYNNDTEETTFDFPKEGKIFHPETRELLYCIEAGVKQNPQTEDQTEQKNSVAFNTNQKNGNTTNQSDRSQLYESTSTPSLPTFEDPDSRSQKIKSETYSENETDPENEEESDRPKNKKKHKHHHKHRGKEKPETVPVHHFKSKSVNLTNFSADIAKFLTPETIALGKVEIPAISTPIPLELSDGVKKQLNPKKKSPKNIETRPEVCGALDKDQLLSSINQFKTPDFASKFFQKHRTTGLFKKREVPVGELITFTNKPLKEPLLSSLPKTSVKLACQCFENILQFTGVSKGKQASSYSSKIVNLLSNYPELKDECFFQLVKQTTDCPDPKVLISTWELFLIIATIFPASRDAEEYILAHLAKNTQNPNKQIAQLAHFTFIRLESRCCIGKDMTNINFNFPFLNKISKDVTESHNQFGCSLYEIMWSQKKSYPYLTIPYILHLMCEQIQLKNGLQTEGLFRLPGNLKKVQEITIEANEDIQCIQELCLHDIASLLKRWFRDLPNPIIPYSMLDQLRNAYDSQTLLKFIETLPKTHRITLMYLIGFLQECAKYSEATLMKDSNLAIVFGPNIVQTNSNEPGRIQLFSTIGNDLTLFLIKEWDTSEIYPLSQSLLQK